MSWSVTVPGNPPSVNDTYAIVYQGVRCPACGRGQPRLGKKAHVETWQDSVAWLVKSARPKGWEPARRTRISIEWWTYRAGRDADGPLKACLDGIKVGLGCDDKGFMPTITSNEKDAANPRTVLTIENIE
jgi:Holliday junction resolvase RusA-like endonuclease